MTLLIDQIIETLAPLETLFTLTQCHGLEGSACRTENSYMGVDDDSPVPVSSIPEHWKV